jgi:lipopolysaccharide/colanic/teichoic acid biosynthesis glycosyltransferase
MEQQIFADNHNDKGLLRLHVADTITSGEHKAIYQPSRMYLWIKRFFDIAASLLLLGIFFLPLLVVALCIRWESPGPAIYRRRVLSLQEWDPHSGEGTLKTFHAYKLRTMVSDAEEYLKRHPHLFDLYQKDWKLQNDPRITKLGAFLRSTSIDEIPQLLNVLRGEMSLIGPRMITLPELARYGDNASRFLSVKPGLTGLWQVSGRQELSYEERVHLDMIYFEQRSLAMDFSILLKTVKCVLLRRGAY